MPTRQRSTTGWRRASPAASTTIAGEMADRTSRDGSPTHLGLRTLVPRCLRFQASTTRSTSRATSTSMASIPSLFSPVTSDVARVPGRGAGRKAQVGGRTAAPPPDERAAHHHVGIWDDVGWSGRIGAHRGRDRQDRPGQRWRHAAVTFDVTAARPASRTWRSCHWRMASSPARIPTLDREEATVACALSEPRLWWPNGSG